MATTDSTKTVDAVYFLNSQIPRSGGTNFTDLDVCLAAADIVGAENVRGAQRIRNLWRIYVNNATARNKLLSCGIDLGHQHIGLMNETPYSITNSSRTIKITLYDVKIHISNEYLEQQLKAKGVRLVTKIKYSHIKDSNGKVTPFQNGERFGYADYTHTSSHPLPRCILVGDSPVRVKHQGQSPPSDICSKCFLMNHSAWNCSNGYACRACKSLTHREGDSSCKYYDETNSCYVFGGRRTDVLSNFTPSQFEYDDQIYVNREQGYQNRKAIIHGEMDVAAQIMKTSDPALAKEFGKCVKVNEDWKDYNDTVMLSICKASANQDEAYKQAIIDTKNRTIVEAMNGDLEWSSGMNWYATKHTRSDRFPGKTN